MPPRRKLTCPHCGNTDTRTLQSNGRSPSSLDYTVLCVARVKEWSFDHVKPQPDELDVNGLAQCGMQWEPNQE